MRARRAVLLHGATLGLAAFLALAAGTTVPLTPTVQPWAMALGMVFLGLPTVLLLRPHREALGRPTRLLTDLSWLGVALVGVPAALFMARRGWLVVPDPGLRVTVALLWGVLLAATTLALVASWRASRPPTGVLVAGSLLLVLLFAAPAFTNAPLVWLVLGSAQVSALYLAALEWGGARPLLRGAVVSLGLAPLLMGAAWVAGEGRLVPFRLSLAEDAFLGVVLTGLVAMVLLPPMVAALSLQAGRRYRMDNKS